ncbi:MAG: carboxypeptidase-like regulatory domain-containing protein [Ignavibacteriaceae bacterium]|nr:carboxypeptidase-like regulatory domain-containing protein [Ignavibacteriaceae bacterium]
MSLNTAAQNRLHISGNVRDSITGEPLPFANVMIRGTSIGSVTDMSGNFSMSLTRGKGVLLISMVGYNTYKFTYDEKLKDTTLTVLLQSAVYELPPVTITGEDPGVAVMRGVIERKIKQKERLSTYTYDLYTKFIVSTDTITAGRSSGLRDTTIFSIFESFSKGYYKEPGKYFNEIYRRRQSVNVPPQANFVAFGTNINLYDDIVNLVGEEVYTPFHPDAVSFYDFKLLQWIRPIEGNTIAKIKVTPKTSQRKLFEGIIDVDGINSVPLEASLRPNRAVQLPFDASLLYHQTFGEFENEFIMPTGLEIITYVPVDIIWLYSARVDVRIYNVAYNYAFNPPVSDEIFEQRRVEAAKEADKEEEEFWVQNMVMPLRPEELSAYEEIRAVRENPDSMLVNSVFEKYIGPVTREIAKLDRDPFTGFDDFFRFNRVSGLNLGGGYKFLFGERLQLITKAGYSFADKKLNGEVNLAYSFDENGKYKISAGAYSRLQRRDEIAAVGERTVTTLALLFKNDYGDYYYADEANIQFEYSTGQLRFVRRNQYARPFSVILGFRTGNNRSALVNTNFALFNRSGIYRYNPLIAEGKMNSVYSELNLNYNQFRRVGNLGMQLRGEYSDPVRTGSEFDFEMANATVYLRTRTFPLWTLDLRVTAGRAWGSLPPQRFYSFETSASSFAVQGAFRGLKVKEFYGDTYVSGFMEHNFGEVFPGLIRIPNVASFGVEFIIAANAGWTAFSKTNSYRNINPQMRSTEDTKDKYYLEGGLGFNRLLLFFRFDVSARFTQTDQPIYFFTFSTATN